MRPIQPAIDPLAHKTAIDAMEAQRAAYRRFARNAEMQRQSLGDGDGDRALAAADATAREFEGLALGARELQPLLEQAAASAAPDQLPDLQRQLDDMLREARHAEAAIHNLTLQLEAWRDAYGRQLAEVGLAPGGDAGDDGLAVAAAAPGTGSPYAPAPRGARAPTGRPTLLDRTG